jgi:hypothetical protein
MEWIQNNSIIVALMCAGFFGLGHWLASWLTPYRWMRVRRRTRCFFGRHDAGVVREESTGRRVQRCDWCDKVIAVYTVNYSNIERDKITRIY